MRFKAKRLIIIFLFFFFTQLLFSENPKVLKSSENPVYGNLNLKLRKDLILGEEAKGPYLFASVSGIEVSDKYIYVLDSRMAKVNVYNLRGGFVREIGRKGEGPGEFMLPNSFCLSPKKDIYVYDLMSQRLSVFDQEGKYKNDLKIEKILSGKFYVDENGYIYSIFSEPESEIGLNMYINFAKFDPKGKEEKVFYKISQLKLIGFEEKGRKGNLLYDHPYMPHLYFTNIYKDNFALMDSMKYKIIIFSKEGEVLLRILKDEKGSKVTGKEREIALSEERTGIPKELQKYATFSETRPFSSNLLSDEKGRIYVERFKLVTEKGGPFIYDIFNSKGEYLYRLSLDFKIELIKNGYIYTISTNEETGEIKIIRYRIENWNEIKF